MTGSVGGMTVPLRLVHRRGRDGRVRLVSVGGRPVGDMAPAELRAFLELLAGGEIGEVEGVVVDDEEVTP